MTKAEFDLVYSKAARYCSYQDRTVHEVRVKLKTLGVTQEEDMARCIDMLKADRFLNEERYVTAFVQGRLEGKQWGKVKIRLALNAKGVEEVLIQQALTAINETDYLQLLRTVAIKKQHTLASMEPNQQRKRLISYLLQKGYEASVVYAIVQEIVEK